ncbi:MAG: glycosyltransferase family 39 protein [Candidatus Omnitrophota bacterium]
MKIFEKESHLIIALVLFSAFIFMIGLGRMPLTDPDEVFYAQTAKEMLERGELLTPLIFGKPQFEKPPLFYWLVLGSFKILGINEFAARIASAILGILGALGTYLLGKALISRRAGILAGLVLATSFNYIALARACVTDMALCVFFLFGFLFFFYGLLSSSGKRPWFLLSAAIFGLAVLTKGPIGIFFPVLIIGLYLISTREIKRLKEIPVFWGTIVLLAVSAPWYILMYKAHGKEFIDLFFGFHNVIRFLEPEHRLGDVFYYYLPILIGGFAPWVAFLPLSIWQNLKEKDRRRRNAGIFLITWFLTIFLFFSFSRTKLPTYIFPIYPALALLVGYLLDTFMKRRLSHRIERWMQASFALFFISIIAGVVGFAIFAGIRYPAAALVSSITGGVFIVLMGLSLAFVYRKEYLKGLCAFMISFALFTIPLSCTVLPEIGIYESSKIESERLLEFADPGEGLGAETQYRRGVAFYTDRIDVLDVHRHHIITGFLDRDERVWCVIKRKNHDQLYTDRDRPYNKTTYVVYELGKKVIVTNRLPESGKFIRKKTP